MCLIGKHAKLYLPSTFQTSDIELLSPKIETKIHLNHPRVTIFVTHLHKTSLKLRFLHVEFKINFVGHSLCYNLVKTRVQYYFSIQSYRILKTAKTSNPKAHNNEKMAVKEKEPYFNIM